MAKKESGSFFGKKRLVVAFGVVQFAREEMSSLGPYATCYISESFGVFFLIRKEE